MYVTAMDVVTEVVMGQEEDADITVGAEVNEVHHGVLPEPG